ncbi:uncharacterized protein BKCO1_3200072 [Diplodia corticola]|uniref:Uncharacterized protein n=1 Tax=Diplodia corticola TaxID=236234 RepID=A0A1J9QXV5_9PEZI|nr:uncharacterized protein BKCO1_3200072 [Diplodia corticola]OJD33201.1 hypothetical protein BKCO1_3200072 [Diplodia corticola]
MIACAQLTLPLRKLFTQRRSRLLIPIAVLLLRALRRFLALELSSLALSAGAVTLPRSGTCNFGPKTPDAQISTPLLQPNPSATLSSPPPPAALMFSSEYSSNMMPSPSASAVFWKLGVEPPVARQV